MLPPRKKPKPSGIERAPKREFPKHRAFVRRHQCSVPGCLDGPIEFAHIRTSANSGTGLKPHDANGISLCSAHHQEQHRIGQPAFERKYGIILAKIAAEFARLSTDATMKESLREAPQPFSAPGFHP